LSMFWFVYRVLEPYGLKLLGQALAGGMVVSLLVVPLVRLSRFLLEPAKPQDIDHMRTIWSIGVIAGAVALGLCIPLPYYVASTFEVQPRCAASVYVELPGELKVLHASGGSVAAGQPLAELTDVDARLAAQRLASQRAELVTRIESIRQRAHTDDAALL